MSPRQGPTVGVVGDSPPVGAVEDGGAIPTTGPASAVLAAAPDWVVAVGEPALSALVREGVDVPVLAVGVDQGVPSVTREGVADAVAAVVEGTADRTTRRVIAASVDGDPAGRLLRDAMVVTGEPARISEYDVHSGGRPVDRVRADGVIAATPAGSRGYLGAAGGPVLEPGTGTLAVVPVAPFRTRGDHWVLDDGAVSLAVRREEHVVLVTDGREWGRVPEGSSVALEPAGDLSLYAVDGGR